MPNNSEDKRARKVIFLLIVLSIIAIGIFLGMGLTAKNFNFHFPRRLKKIAAIILVSYGIGSSATTFQTITDNHILTPSIMGLDSLYLFIQTVVVFLFGSRQLSLMTGYSDFLISIGVMVLAAWILFFLLFRGKQGDVYFLVLTGMIMGGLFNGMATFMQVLLDPNEFSVLEGKMFASFNNINTDLLGISAIIVLIVIILQYKDHADFDALSLGSEIAINLGVNYKGLVLKTLLTTAILMSVSTVLVGPITFLGILLVSLSRQLLKTYKHKYLIMGSILIGVLALTIGMFVTERIFQFQTTISVIINFIGGIFFLYLMVKESRV